MGLEPIAIAAILAALFLGGILKGATGAGVPVVAVPVMVLFVDLPVAVSVMAVTNLVTNTAQGWQFRAELTDRSLSGLFAAACGVGCILGTVVLATAPSSALLVVLACVVLVYIMFRMASPEWALGRRAGRRLSAVAGVIGGVLQGATGISAPVTITFLNALRMDRPEFIAVISLAFAVMAIPQVATLWAYGLLDPQRFLLGLAVTVCVFAGMPVGAAAARRLGPRVFDRVILSLLALIALKLLYEGIA